MINWGKFKRRLDAPFTFYGIEIPWLFSVGISRPYNNSINIYRSAPYLEVSWVLKGRYTEEILGKDELKVRIPSIIPVTGSLSRLTVMRPTWCFVIRGPHRKTWKEYNPKTNKTNTYTRGRCLIKEE